MQSAQATSANAKLSGCAALANHRLMKIQLPFALGAIVSMANTMTGLSTPATNITFSGHSFIPQGSIAVH